MEKNMQKQYYQKICLNGHQLTFFYESSTTPNPPEYCESCGKQVIVTCLNCANPILGVSDDDYYFYPETFPVPNYCKHCSKPYPWTELIFRNTEELVLLDDNLTDSNRDLINEAIPDLLVDTPKTKVAIAKFKKGFQTTSSIVKDSLRELLVDVLSETAKKAIFPD